jgi:hypothetical protein
MGYACFVQSRIAQFDFCFFELPEIEMLILVAITSKALRLVRILFDSHASLALIAEHLFSLLLCIAWCGIEHEFFLLLSDLVFELMHSFLIPRLSICVH